MQHIVKPIKAVSKSYTTKSGEVKESVSKRVDFGVDDTFEVGDMVAVILKTDFDNMENTVADKDATIDDLNESIDKYKAELEAKTDKIGELSKDIKLLKKNVETFKNMVSAKDKIIADLENNVSDKDDAISKLESTVNVKDNELSTSGNIIAGLNNDVAELTATVGELKPLLLSKDATINDLEKQIAIYDAVDVDKLKTKADELDKSKNVVIFQQKQITEYIQLVNYHKETATAYKNQNPISKFIGRDATADISLPVLSLIDLSGNPISNDNDATPDSDAVDDSEKSTTKDNITYI